MSHIINGHKIALSDFLKQYPGTTLVSDSVKRKASKTSKANGCGKWRLGKKLSEEQKKRMSERNSGKGNPFYGKRHSEKTMRKMKKNHSDFSGDNNPFRLWWQDANDDDKAKFKMTLSDGWKKAKENKEEFNKLREKRSKLTCEAHANMRMKKFGRGHLRGYFYSKRQKKKIYYRSSYEKAFLEWCDSQDSIVSFFGCDFTIPYGHDGITRNYIPDFIINDVVLVEIKPTGLINTDQNKRKALAGQEYCNNKGWIYLVITEEELKDLSFIIQIVDGKVSSNKKDSINN